MSPIANIFRSVADLWSLLVGLKITGVFFVKPHRTVHYPRQEVDHKINASYRGPIHLIALDADPTKSRCIACMACVNACPSSCITVTRAAAPKLTPEQEQEMREAEERGESVKRPTAPREPGRWLNDFSLCSLCGLCVEVCPTDCIAFSQDLYSTSRSRGPLVHDLLLTFPGHSRLDAPAGSQAKET